MYLAMGNLFGLPCRGGPHQPAPIETIIVTPQILSFMPCSPQLCSPSPVKKYPLAGSYSPSRAAQGLSQPLGHLPKAICPADLSSLLAF